MEDFGDILYILVMLGALVFSVIRKAQQSKNKPTMSESDKSSPYDPMAEEEPLMEELREMFAKPKRPEPQPVVQKPVQVKNKTVEKTFSKKTNRTIIPKKTEPLKVIHTDDDDEGFVFDADEVDLRKAVIYSEILNRPYQ